LEKETPLVLPRKTNKITFLFSIFVYTTHKKTMTSRVATNFVFDNQGEARYLRVNRDDQPLQGQVPLTYQVYTGNGNETIAYDGPNCLVIDSVLSAGDLTIDFSDMQNWLGRSTSVIVEHQLSNDIQLDFGAGWLYVPPLTSPSHTSTFPKEISPAVGQLIFYQIDKAIILTQTVVFPQRIIPGGPGQVLTTNAGTGVVDWEDPVAVAPKSLAFKWNAANTNDLNLNTAQEVEFVVDNANNDTSLTLGGGSGAGLCQRFTTTRATKYTINFDGFIVSSPTITYRGFIAIDSDIWAYSESSLGSTGQTLHGQVTLDLPANTIIAFYIGNASGPVTPIYPLDTNYGVISITEH
jgi:hypothetical protein